MAFTIFGKVDVKNRAFGNNITLHNNFSHFRGGGGFTASPPPGYATGKFLCAHFANALRNNSTLLISNTQLSKFGKMQEKWVTQYFSTYSMLSYWFIKKETSSTPSILFGIRSHAKVSQNLSWIRRFAASAVWSAVRKLTRQLVNWS